MRVLHICQTYPPMVSGAAITAHNLAQGFARRDHTVMVLTASDKGPPYAENSKGVEVVRLRSRQNLVRSDQRFVVFNPGEIRKHILLFQPDIIHFHDPLNLGLAGLRAVKGLEITTAYTAHQLPWYMAAYAPNIPFLRKNIEVVFWQYARWLLKRFDAVISPSTTVSQLILQKGGIASEVISNGIDLACFSPPSNVLDKNSLLEKYNLNDEPIVVYAGRIDVDKRVDLVIRAFAEASQDFAGQLLVLGDGTQRKKLMRLCKHLVPSRHYSFPGFVHDRDELASLYRLGSVFATGSEIETLGLAVLEAMASGLPVAAVDRGALPELIQDGVNGFLVDAGDYLVMAEKIRFLWSHKAERLQMGQAARRKAASHGLDVSLDHHEVLYSRLVQN